MRTDPTTLKRACGVGVLRGCGAAGWGGCAGGGGAGEGDEAVESGS
jgi:hypothetical protein